MRNNIRIKIVAEEISARILPLILADRIVTKTQVTAWINSGMKIAKINGLLSLALQGKGTGAFETLTIIKNGLNDFLTKYTDDIYYAAAGIEENDLMEWVIESENPCPDCEVRSGEVKTFSEWRLEGLPREGATICGANCKCELHKV